MIYNIYSVYYLTVTQRLYFKPWKFEMENDRWIMVTFGYKNDSQYIYSVLLLDRYPTVIF